MTHWWCHRRKHPGSTQDRGQEAPRKHPRSTHDLPRLKHIFWKQTLWYKIDKLKNGNNKKIICRLWNTFWFSFQKERYFLICSCSFLYSNILHPMETLSNRFKKSRSLEQFFLKKVKTIFETKYLCFLTFPACF